MATDTQINANRSNAQASTGPRTDAGKYRSSRNATALGLFTARDFVRPSEREEYDALSAALRADLNPEGALEETFAAAIIGASWRLRRCATIEARMAGPAYGFDDLDHASLDAILDPMVADESTQRLQFSVDRARAQAHNLLRRSLTELRRLQTQRQIRHEIFEGNPDAPDPDLTSYDDVSVALDRLDRARLRNKQQADSAIRDAVMAPVPSPAPASAGAQLASFCKQPALHENPVASEPAPEDIGR
jgi:hypothetical protein